MQCTLYTEQCTWLNFRKDSDIGPKGQEKEVDTESKEKMQDIRSVFWSSREMRQDNQVEADTFVNIMTELLQQESIKGNLLIKYRAATFVSSTRR